MLRLAIPNGSLEEGTFRLFEQASLPIKRRGARDYRLSIYDPRIEEVSLYGREKLQNIFPKENSILGLPATIGSLRPEPMLKMF